MEEKPIKKGKKFKKAKFKRPSRDTYIITLLAAIYLLNPLILGSVSYLVPNNEDLIHTITNYMNGNFHVLMTIGAALFGTKGVNQNKINSNFISNSKKKLV